MTWLNKAVQHVKGEMTKLSDWLFAKNEEEKPQPEEEAPVEEKDSDQIEQDPPEAPKRSKLDEQYDAWLLRGHALIDKNQDIPDDMKQHYKDELAKEARNYAAMTNEEREKRHSELWAQYRTLKSTPEYNSLNLLEQEARNQRELYDKYGDTGDVPLSDDDPRLHKSAAPAVVAAYCAGGNELAAATIIFLGSLMGWKYLQQKQNYEPLGTHEKTIDSYGQSGKNKPHGGVSTPASPDPDDDWEPEEERKTNPTKSESKVWRDFEHYKRDIKTNGKSGSAREYYQWDHLHNDIEVYDSNFNHKGSMDPRSGLTHKPAVVGRKLKW